MLFAFAAAALPAPPLSSTALHEAIISPLARRHSRAALWRNPAGGHLLEAALKSPTSATALRSGHCSSGVLNDDAAALPSAPLDASRRLFSRHPDGELSLRVHSIDGTLWAEVWSNDVRLARVKADALGPKVLPSGVFGAPSWSPSGHKVAWVAEEPAPPKQRANYWQPDGDDDTPSAASDAFRMRRGLGEAIGVTNAVVAVLDWETDELQVLAADELLPAGTLADGERAVPAHVTFDTNDGLIVAVHTLPARTPGLSACLTADVALAGAAVGAAARCLTRARALAHAAAESADGGRSRTARDDDEFAARATTFDVRR